MTDSESADDTKSWSVPFALDSEDTRDPVTTSRRRRLSDVGDGSNGDGDGGDAEGPSAWDRLAVRGRRLAQPAPRRPKASPSGSGGPKAAPGPPDETVPPASSGDGLAAPRIRSSPEGASPDAPRESPPPADSAEPWGVTPLPVSADKPGRRRPNRSAAPASVGKRTDPAAPPGPETDAPSTTEGSTVAPLAAGPPSEAVPTQAVSSKAGSSDAASSQAGAAADGPSEDAPTSAVPSVPDAPGATTPRANSPRRPLRPPPADPAGFEEMRVGADDGRTPDWMARRIVESEAPGAAYELGRPRRWGRRKVTVLRTRTNRRLVRRIDTWTVFKVSLMFYLLMVIIVLVAGVATWSVAQHLGFIGDIQKSVRSLADDKTFVFRGADALRWGAVGGVALGLLGTLFNTVAAMLYNLLSDVIGGLQVIVVTEPD
jgi:hypothetical protein